MGFTKKQRREQKQQFLRRVHDAKRPKLKASQPQASTPPAPDKVPDQEQDQSKA
ncbi:MAG TPA: hypothetical protein VFN35_29435 [Ktedonobacteraceae bacterium]|nr:hypothetical protein [Ktedonobacteraceae bacterium]